MKPIQQLRVRRRVAADSRIGLVLKYFNQHGYSLVDEVEQRLIERWLPFALAAQGKLDRHEAIVAISKLRGNIAAIEHLAGMDTDSDISRHDPLCLFKDLESASAQRSN